uniref:non-specific serine/threonine protein kinase n=1 Tax=Tanacetum cinerariifolium TaxID=118510 RepID=A0A6L2NGQ9_TANCI|nr:protein kinase, ATP binding site-containing protein [Tanacetum cinerariifolium]
MSLGKAFNVVVFHHENIILLIGFCDEYDEMVMVCEDVNASLVEYLDNREKRHHSWGERLKICIGIAKGLSYLNSGVGEVGRVIHKDVQSKNIMLDENLVPKISGFGDSVLFPPNKPYAKINASACPGNDRDPIYHETGLLNTESDVYSYGIVMFEMLIGMVADQERVVGDYKPQTLINIVRRCYDDRHELLIDPSLRDHIDRRSFNMFTEIAYKCISFNIKDRPTMDEIVKTIEKALDIHNQGALSRSAKLKLELQKKFVIPLEDIKKASSDFQEITESRYGNELHRGFLYDSWKKGSVAIKRCLSSPFQNELMLVSRLHHENIIPFVGYCDEDREPIIVYEWADNGSVFSYLKNYSLSWVQRLKICIGASRGLKYLHSGIGEYEIIIHGDFSNKHILLSKNLEAQVCGLSSSFLVPKNHSDAKVYKNLPDNLYVTDPAYRESYIPKIESNVYSLGIVLFEILTGMRVDEKTCIGDEELNMVTLVRRYYNDGFEKYIDPRIRDEIDAPSFHIFKEIAYKCISCHIKDRPSVNKIIKRLEEALYTQNHGAASTISRINHKLEDFRIPLKDINSSIGVKGQETRIGDGGFGVVYKGQPSERWKHCSVAIKCLRPESYQGEHEFRNELNMIFNFNHENIIPFIGYCDEGNEKIIVYEYASNGSLDCHLTDKNKRRFLTWEHRLKICLGAARGLDYLHSGLGEDSRVIHRDVKSGNILLDHNLVAKICDFGLSKSGPINQQHTQVYTNAAGTNFYVDPVYHESGVLRKESDVYSFGVVMFELLSGMLAYNRRREVAFQCISFNSKERPTMEMIVDRVEQALELQVTNPGDLKQKVTEN